MAAYSLAGFVWDKDNNNPPSATVKVQGIFIKRLGSSSPTTYSAISTTDAFGYYSLNLGDASWLDTTGVWGNGDEVVLLFWMPSTDNRTSDTLIQFANYIHVIDEVGGTNSHFKDVRLMLNIPPDCGFNMATSAERLASVSITNTTTDSPHGTDTLAGTVPVRMYQHYNYASQSVFPISRRTQTDWDWQYSPNPGTDTESNNNNNLSHIWSTVGDYTVHLKAFDPPLDWCETTKDIRILYRAPTPDFTWLPYPAGVDTDITFTEANTDPDNRIGTNTANPGVEYKWYVDIGAGFVYQSGFDNIDLVRQFATNGDKWVRLVIYWNDGFTDRTSQVTKKIVVSNTPPVADYTTASETKCSVEYIWTSTSYDLDGTVDYHDWYLYELPSGNLLSNVGGAAQTSFKYAVTEIGQYRIVLTVTDNNGSNDTKTTDFEVTEIDCGAGESGQQILRTMWTPGAASCATWIKKKPHIKAELVSEKDRKRAPKLEGDLIDTRDEKRRSGWNSTLINKKP